MEKGRVGHEFDISHAARDQFLNFQHLSENLAGADEQDRPFEDLNHEFDWIDLDLDLESEDDDEDAEDSKREREAIENNNAIMNDNITMIRSQRTSRRKNQYS